MELDTHINTCITHTCIKCDIAKPAYKRGEQTHSKPAMCGWAVFVGVGVIHGAFVMQPWPQDTCVNRDDCSKLS